MQALSASDFDFYRELLLTKSGLSLEEDKNYLLHSRVSPIAMSLGYEDLQSFTKELRSFMKPDVVDQIVEAMTTNETSFFRDVKPFETLKSLLPDLMAKKQDKTIRVWSAASSSGQEAYSLAMLFKESLKDQPGWRYEIVGTDISEPVLERARQGEYSEFEVRRGLTDDQVRHNFNQQGKTWRVNSELKTNVRFEFLNLLDSYDRMGAFDIIFCRNVLIYFNKDTKAAVLNKMARVMRPYGYLFLGACETAINLDVPLKNIPGSSGVLVPKNFNF